MAISHGTPVDSHGAPVDVSAATSNRNHASLLDGPAACGYHPTNDPEQNGNAG
jgi:hypothetical protein